MGDEDRFDTIHNLFGSAWQVRGGIGGVSRKWIVGMLRGQKRICQELTAHIGDLHCGIAYLLDLHGTLSSPETTIIMIMRTRI